MAQVVGFNLKRISIDRKEEIKGKIEVKYDISMKDVKKAKLDLSKEKEAISFEFRFIINYEPKIANIEFEGNVLTLVDSKEAKEIFKTWKKKQVPSQIRLILFNLILTKCSIKALALEDDLNLPYHVPVPRLTPTPQTQGNSYTG